MNKLTKTLGMTLHRFTSQPLDRQEAQEQLDNAVNEDVTDLMDQIGLAEMPMVGLFLSQAAGVIQITFNEATDSPRRIKITLNYEVIEGELDVERFVKKFREAKRL